MMKIITSLFLFLNIINYSYCVNSNVPTPSPTPSPHKLNSELTFVNTDELYKVEKYIEIVGVQPNFHQKLGLIILRKVEKRKHSKLIDKILHRIQEDCDIIIYKDGEEEKVKVIEISERLIKYKKCDFLDGPTYSISKSNVFLIKYSNGTTEVIKSQESISNNNTITSDQYSKRVNTTGAGFVGFLAGLLFGFIGMLFALPFEKGIKRKAFWKGWGFGFVILLLLIVAYVTNQFKS